MPLTREQAIEIARLHAAGPNRPSYYSEPFQPHEWVIDAIMDANLNADARAHCPTLTPRWFTGHWRDWHRGHGCILDDGKPRSPAGHEEITKHNSEFAAAVAKIEQITKTPSAGGV